MTPENPGKFRESLRWQRQLRTAGFRCLVSALATAIQVALFVHFTSYLKIGGWPPQPRLLFWSWVLALDVGITFGCFGLFSAQRWNERILALVLLGLQFLSLLMLFRTGVLFYAALHDTTSIH